MIKRDLLKTVTATCGGIALAHRNSAMANENVNRELDAGTAMDLITAAGGKSALDAFIGIDNLTVTGSGGNFSVTFVGTQATTNMQQIFGDAADATSGTNLRLITTGYNAASEVTSITDPSSTINFTRDGLGRATTLTQSVAGLTPTISLNQAFDSMSNRTELKGSIGSTSDLKNSYQYDKLQRLTDIVQQGQAGGNAVAAKHFTQSYNALSQRTNISRYQCTGTTNAVATSDFTYDTANRLSGIAHKQGVTNLDTYAYVYDPLSRISSVTSTAEGATTYNYDQTSQVVGATNTGVSNETYGFDANGNRNTSGYSIGTNNQTKSGLGFTYTYDNEGNRITKTETATGKVTSYEWDYRNRLTSVKDRAISGGAIVRQVDYQYDAMNRLVRRDFDADGAGAGVATSQFWVYDEGINAVYQFDGAAASNLTHRYLWSNAVDEIFADEQLTSPSVAGNVLYPLSDHLGTARDIADMNEGTGVTTVTNHRRYDSFGKLISETNTAVDLIFGFTGKQLDEATGLQHNLNRWYDNSLGQWVSEDPIGFKAGDENVRRYVSNRLTRGLDSLGLYEDEYQSPFVIVTGFAPWNTMPQTPDGQNPSTRIAALLGTLLTESGIPNEVIPNIPVVWNEIENTLDDAIDRIHADHPNHPIIVISFGVGRRFQVESLADNDRVGQDNNGNDPPSPGSNEPDGPVTAHNQLGPHFADVLGIPNNNGNDGFICNSTCYKLIRLQNDGDIAGGGFFHVPQNPSPGQIRRILRSLVDGVIGATGDFDGDGTPNYTDPDPF
jgi:RHS repeat-associated protein